MQMKTRKRGAKPDPTSLRSRSIAAGLPYNAVFCRVKRGWTEERALSEPLKVK